MKNINPIYTKSWKDLKEHYIEIKNIKIKKLFLKNPKRFYDFSILFKKKILIDFSKNIITKKTLNKLFLFAKECNLKYAINSMFNGKNINFTENNPVLHIALRNKKNNPIYLNKKNIMIDINNVLKKMKKFCENVINGKWIGYSGNKITDIVNIGIGGSDLGPYMVTEALTPYKNHLSMHFVSNIDSTHIIETIKYLNPSTTLFLISSKTFITQETMTNAYNARQWFLKHSKNKKFIKNHFIAISSNTKKAIEFGINKKNIFKFWNWVGGRYSLWSSVGLSISLSIGFNNFKNLLNGAYDMDQHFLKTPLEKNIPVILGLIGIWYNNFFNMETEAILSYDQYMHKFSSYIQQCNMESNGKSIDRNGKKIFYQTGPIVWGDVGTNGQHAFYQLIHQGTKIIPCDFIAPTISHNPLNDSHQKLLSHFFAQTEALAFGKSKKDIKKELTTYEKKLNLIKSIIPFKVFYGNRPTNSILIDKITPYTLGSLIAMYEHKIFTQGVLLNIYTFDQWGVELGKQLSKKILPELKKNKKTILYNSSTNGLINFYKKCNKKF
ncbi:glucose-6-phosphate isomerase [Sodalis-like secondary symbiont of Drepanosiphum platanoidis]|uniref:glucose-6-phosphate isomerase n=1 Tax=Sodalis-like secondary symbiont of Drepanosiphum platanoidis TaxID=2994493 RepID=UPI003464E7E9